MKLRLNTIASVIACLFAAVALADVLTLAFGIEAVHLFVKPFLMPLLCAAAVAQALPHGGWSKPLLLLVIALVFHTAGDILLMPDGFVWFASGLLAFLIGHLFYLGIFIPATIGRLSLTPSKLLWCVAVPVIAVPAVLVPLFGIFWPLNAAVTVYAAVLFMMLACGVCGIVGKVRFSPILAVGAALFIISDSLIAISSFAGIDFALRHALTMATYLAAEVCLVTFALREDL